MPFIIVGSFIFFNSTLAIKRGLRVRYVSEAPSASLPPWRCTAHVMPVGVLEFQEQRLLFLPGPQTILCVHPQSTC